jgi:hypothetical protein
MLTELRFIDAGSGIYEINGDIRIACPANTG